MERTPYFYYARVLTLALIALLLWFAADANAAKERPQSYIAKWQDGSTVIISPDACTLKSDWFKGWKRAEFNWRGKQYAACWRLDPALPGLVITIDAAGDVGMVPMEYFKPLTSA